MRNIQSVVIVTLSIVIVALAVRYSRDCRPPKDQTRLPNLVQCRIMGVDRAGKPSWLYGMCSK